MKWKIWSLNGRQSALSLKKFTVASTEEEYKNTLEIESMRALLLFRPLLEGKININELFGTGLAFGTDRETPGFLKKEKREKREKTGKKWKSDISSWMEDIKEPKNRLISVRPMTRIN